MAIRPKNLVPSNRGVMKPDDTAQRNGNIINPPRYPEFGGASAVAKTLHKAPYGTIRHVGNKG